MHAFLHWNPVNMFTQPLLFQIMRFSQIQETTSKMSSAYRSIGVANADLSPEPLERCLLCNPNQPCQPTTYPRVPHLPHRYIPAPLKWPLWPTLDFYLHFTPRSNFHRKYWKLSPDIIQKSMLTIVMISVWRLVHLQKRVNSITSWKHYK